MTSTLPVMYDDTLAPGVISDELQPVIDKFGLEKNCRELFENGWTIVENVASLDFNDQVRIGILERLHVTDDKGECVGSMMLHKSPVLAQATMNPKLLAMAEFSVGRGFLLMRLAATVKPEGGSGIAMHNDMNWFPAPFPEHNMVLTACWATDGFSRAGGSTRVVPRSHLLKRHPTHSEIAAEADTIAIECPPNCAVLWDGRTWHSSGRRELPGQRVVAHISYIRLAARPVDDYTPWADELVAAHGPVMAQLLGQHDMLQCQAGGFADSAKVVTTFNNSKR
ncbi:MAG: phytanoyl-CoA dioxygenase family protein [Arenicellales bacterium]|nr:phytanoyl-CoA dioxygenase family protein [Arenicellales bacterium]